MFVVLLLAAALALCIEWHFIHSNSNCIQPINHTAVSRAKTAGQRYVVVTLCDQAFASAAVELVRLLRGTGAYDGDIVVLFFGEMIPKLQWEDARVFPQSAEEIMARKPQRPPCTGDGSDMRLKRIRASAAYYYKAAIFSAEFFAKRWDRLLYLDSRMNIHQPNIQSLFDSIDVTGAIMGNPDSWPSATWKLSTQFAPECNTSLFKSIESAYNLNYADYFQTGVILLDTSILREGTLREIQELYHQYAEIISNSDQCIFNIYWGRNMHNLYKPLPYRLDGLLLVPYDYSPLTTGAKYIITANRP